MRTFIMKTINFVEEESKILFPQANTFYRDLDFINILNDSEMKISEIADLYEFDIRQGGYYSAAARYLGFVEKSHNGYCLTQAGKELNKMNYKTKNLTIIKAMISHKPFYLALKQYLDTGKIDNPLIAQTILEVSPNVNSLETALRRASGILPWIKWIISLTVQDKS